MDYSHLLNRAWTVVWTHKFLILLGVLAALGGGGGNNFRWQLNGDQGGGKPTVDFGEGALAGIPMALIIVFALLALAIGLLLWAITIVARGGLIAAVDTIERGEQTTFATAWHRGWQKVWSLLGIAVLPAIPLLISLVVGLGTTGALAGLAKFLGIALDIPLRTGFGMTLVGLACLAAPVALVLMLLRNFAERACLLENLDVIAAYRRGWAVFTTNLGPAIILFLIQLALTIVLTIGLIGPGIIMMLCFLFWPLLLLIGGAITAYFSTLWTLAWREWTVAPPSVTLTPTPTPVG